MLDVAGPRGQAAEVEVQVIALGDDIAWVSLPGEIFVELGLAIKQDSPFPHTIIAELANGSIGYVPSRRAYAQGNYEVVSARAPRARARCWWTRRWRCSRSSTWRRPGTGRSEGPTA